MTDWIANGESGASVRAKLNSEIAQQAAPVVALSGTELTISKLYTLVSEFNFPDSFDSTLTGLDLPNLTTVLGPLSLSMASLTTITLPSLVTIGGSWTGHLPALPSLNLPVLTSIESFSGIMGSLTSLNLPSLVTVRNHFDPSVASLPSLDLSAVVSIGGDLDIYSEQMTTLTLTSATKRIGGIVSFENVGKHTQASVDNLLVRLAALNGTGGTTSFANKTVDLSGGTNASPSATGLAAKATLEGRGCTVTVN